MEDCVTRSQETAPVDWAGQETAVIEVSWLCSSHEHKTADFNLNSKINEMYKFCLNMCWPECPRGRYGADCREICDCKNNGTCERVTGECHCPPGYYGHLCEHGKNKLHLFNLILHPDSYIQLCNDSIFLLFKSMPCWFPWTSLPAFVWLPCQCTLWPWNWPLSLSSRISRTPLWQRCRGALVWCGW